MRVKPPKLPVDEQSPFEHDKLARLESAERLTYLLERAQTPYVLSIDAKYGDGKTIFIQMWRHYLKTKGFHSLYFNAWEADFTSDPLVAFIGEMDAEIENILKEKGASGKLRQAWSNVKKSSAYLAKRVIPVGVKISTVGLLDLEEFTKQVTNQSIAALAEDIAKDQVQKYTAIKDQIARFKTSLAELIKTLTPAEQQPHLPLVFFVDEMDRCRPPYAIELLERIKHFFQVEGMVFVLAVDKAQLGHSIRSVYGAGIDVDGYLRRFIDLSYRLPAPDTKEYYSHLYEIFGLSDLLDKSGCAGPLEYVDDSIHTFGQLAHIFGLSKRVQEQCFSSLSVILLTAKQSDRIQLLLLFSLLAIQAADQDLYDDFVRGGKQVTDVLALVSSTSLGLAFLESKYGARFEAYLLNPE